MEYRDRPRSVADWLVFLSKPEEPVRVAAGSLTPTVDLLPNPSPPDDPTGIPLIQVLVVGGATLVLVILGSLALRHFLGTISGVTVSQLAAKANSLQNIGLNYCKDGEYHKALDFYQQALVTFQEIPDRLHEAHCLDNIGIDYYSGREYREAIDYFRQARVIYQEISDREDEANALFFINSLGEHFKSLDSFQRARAIYREINAYEDEANSLYNIGINYCNGREYREAINYFRQARAIYQEIGHREDEADALEMINLVEDLF